jgi:RimJ/RimL family protein N-acetyltransferase
MQLATNAAPELSYIPTIETERLILRPLRESDTDAYAAMMADPEVAYFLTADQKPLSAADSWRQVAMLLGHWALRGFGMWAVAERSDPDRLVGRLGPHQPPGWPDFEIGWGLARSVWGRGYATEGAAAAMEYAFETLRRPRVISLIDPANTRSASVARRLGERPSGASWNFHGRRLDVYAIAREEWEALTAAGPPGRQSV